jgi:hypothetical protein
MDSANTPQRKNFRCVFNRYVSDYNRDAVVRSIISQFEGYFAEPEVTVTDNGFIISLTLGNNLSATMARDKILWNQFVDSVTAADAIRKIQIIRLPKSSAENEGTVGAWGPHGSNSGVDEIMVADGHPIPHKEYKIDMGDRADGPPTVTASLHYADPTGTMLPQVYGPGAETGEPVDEDLKSDITDMKSDPTTELDSGKPAKSHPKLFMGFRVVAIDSDTGGAFTLNRPNEFQSVNDAPRDGGLHQEATPATGIGGGAPISGASWYVTQPGNEQGTDLGTERIKSDSTAAPFGNITAGKDEPEVEDVESAIDLPQSRGGSQSVPDGGVVEGWFASNHFGLNETYGYEGDVDGYEL